MFETNPMPKSQDFSEILRLYGDVAYRMAYQLTGGRESDARDLVQDAFIKIWRHWDVQKPDSFKGWMYRLMHNLYMDHLRKKYRHPTLSLDSPAPDSETPWEQNLADGVVGIEESIEKKDVKRQVAQALSRLDVEFRTVVVLCDMEGLPYDEIAHIVGCPIGTVRSRIHRGRGQLRQVLGQLLKEQKQEKEVRHDL